MKTLLQSAYPYLPVPIQNLGISAYGYMYRRERFGAAFEPTVAEFEERDRWDPERMREYTNSALRAVLRREQRPVHKGAQETEFGSLSGSGAVRNGVLQNDNLRAELPFMTVTGAGKVNVVDEAVDYTLRVTLHDRPGVDDPAALRELEGRAIPVRIEGPIDELNYRVDIAAALKEEIENRAREELQDRLREGLRRIIP